MKLEMRVWDLDVSMVLEDEDTDNQLYLLETAKQLIEALEFMENVDISIKTNKKEDTEHEESDPESDPESMTDLNDAAPSLE